MEGIKTRRKPRMMLLVWMTKVVGLVASAMRGAGSGVPGKSAAYTNLEPISRCFPKCIPRIPTVPRGEDIGSVSSTSVYDKCCVNVLLGLHGTTQTPM